MLGWTEALSFAMMLRATSVYYRNSTRPPLSSHDATLEVSSRTALDPRLLCLVVEDRAKLALVFLVEPLEVGVADCSVVHAAGGVVRGFARVFECGDTG